MNTNFEKIFIEQCAPLLARIKVSNLFSIKCTDYSKLKNKIDTLNYSLNNKDIYIKILRNLICSDSNYLIFVYRKTRLSNRINEKLIREFLSQYGYSNCKELNDYLYVLANKLLCSKIFPHEIGIFLGYPLNDVKAFIKEKGKNFVACGDWKVYYNKIHCEKVFLVYKKCKEKYIELYKKGNSIEQIALAS